jgi:hypothetical protein
MKRTNSFIHDFKTIKIEMTTNVDDNIIKSLTPPKPNFLMDYFMNRKESISEYETPESK